MLDSATEESQRYFTPAPGDGRTFTQNCEVTSKHLMEGERPWLT